MTDLAKLVVTLEAQTAQYQAQLEQAQRKLQTFSSSMDRMLSGLAGKIAAGFALGSIMEFADGLLESAASLERMSQSSGVAVEQLSALQFVAKASGSDTESLGIAMRKLNVNISQAADPASKSAAAFRSMGLSLTDTSGKAKSTDQVLMDIADKFAGYSDGANKTALAVQLFGRAGEQLIPTLNRGSAGIKELEAAARSAGVVIDSQTAKAAEAFEIQMKILQAQLQGAGIAIMKDLLPTLGDLADAFMASSSSAGGFAGAAEPIADFLKLMADAASVAMTRLKLVGNAIGGVAATLVALATGNFKQAGAIWKDISDQDAKIQEDGQKRLAAIWEAGGADVLRKFTITAQRIKEEAGSLTGDKLGEKAFLQLAKALESLQQQAASIDVSSGIKKSNEAAMQFSVTAGSLSLAVKEAGAAGADMALKLVAAGRALDLKEAQLAIGNLTRGLQEQAAMFGLSQRQVEAYKLSTGALGAQLRLMGADGIAAKAAILALDTALEAKESEQAMVSLTAEVDRLTGKLGDAGAAAFDLQHKMVSQQFSDTGNAAGLAKLQTLKDLTGQQAVYNDLQRQAALIDGELANKEALIAANRARGAITDLQAAGEEDAARSAALVKLQAINAQMQELAGYTTDPAIVAGVAKFNTSLVTLAASVNQVTQGIRAGFQSAFESSVASFLDGTATMKQALTSFLKNFEKQLADMAAKDLTQHLLGDLGGAGSSGGGSGWIGGLVSMFGGARAGGGPIASGVPYLVGENGPEIVVPGLSGSVVPTASLSKPAVIHQSFNFPPGAQITRSTQMQIAAAAGRGVNAANRRNN